MKMKWLMYAGMAITILSAACQDITVGYLKADFAGYPTGKMEIYDIPLKIQELKVKQALFGESPLKTELDARRELSELAQKRYDLHADTVKSVVDSITRFEDSKEEADIQLVKQLQEKLDNVLIPRQDELRKELNMTKVELQNAQKALDEYADQLGIPTEDVLKSQIADLEYRLKFEIPWVTPEIEGVEGTEPLVYKIVQAKGPNPEAVNQFMTYTEIIGGGRICVKQEVVANVPAGEYVMSVRVNNEEREKVFRNAFTFVVKKL